MGKQNSRGCGWVRILAVCLGAVLSGRALGVERRVPTEYGTIQAAINASVAGDEVVIAPGIYKGDGNRDLDLLGKAITVRSQDPNDWAVVQATVIDCAAVTAHRGFYFHSGEGLDSRVVGLTIRNGRSPSSYGGAILCESSSPNIDRCWIVGCRAEMGGGGIAFLGGSPRVSRCVIRDNYVMPHNYNAAAGGGVYCGADNGVITDSLITGNSVSTDSEGQPFLFSVGGGIAAAGGSLRLVNCSIVGNHARYSAGGVYSSGSVVLMENCIVWGNSASKAGTEQIVGGPLVTYSDVQGGYSGQGNIDADPCMCPISGDYRLMRGSPCIDAGTAEPNAGLSNTDVDGAARSVDGNGDGVVRPDMGAYERPGSRPLILVDTRLIDMVGWVGGPTPDAKDFSVVNDGAGVLSWTISTDCSWLRANPLVGQSTDGVDSVSLSADPNGLTVGDHWCQVIVSDVDSARQAASVQVRLRVRHVRRVPSDYSTIQSAIDAAEDCDMVLVGEGTHRGAGNRDLTLGGKAIIVRGENGAEKTVIDCEGQGRGFNLYQGERSDTIIEDLSVINGFAIAGDYYGGAGILCKANSPIVRRCIISGNRSLANAGGISCMYGQPQILNCIVRGNFASGMGGGIGVAQTPGTVIRDCLIVGNSALQGGGGVFTSITGVALGGCTIVGNAAGENGGGLLSSMRSIATLSNSIVWGNTAPMGPQIAGQYSGGSVSLWFSDVQGGPNAISGMRNTQLAWGEGCIDADPLFKDPYGADGDANTWQDNDYHLSVYSPCKNAGDPNGDYAGQTDIDGEARRMGGQVDMGADERSYFWVECGSGGGEALGLLAMMGMWFVRRRS